MYKQDYETAVAIGHISGAASFRVVGMNPDIDVTREDLWSIGTTYEFPPDAGIQMSIVSSSANDANGGTGSRQVSIYYLDASGKEQTESVTMNGTTPVLTAATNIRRVNDFYVTSVGSSGSSQGDIVLQNTGGTVTYSKISATTSRARQCIWTVPAGKRAIITEVSIGGSPEGGSASNYIEGYLRATTHPITKQRTPGVFLFQWGMIASSSTVVAELKTPVVIPSLCDIKISAQSRATVSNVLSVASFSGYMEWS